MWKGGRATGITILACMYNPKKVNADLVINPAPSQKNFQKMVNYIVHLFKNVCAWIIILS